MEKGFYHASVGYWQTISEPSADVKASYPSGTIEVSTIPGPGYIFNGSSWVGPTVEWKTNTASDMVRSERKSRLVKQVDPIASNTLRWNALSTEQQTQLSTYRQELLDITAKPGFPWYDLVLTQGVNAALWPVKPSFV
jgi:hypothetical protein